MENSDTEARAAAESLLVGSVQHHSLYHSHGPYCVPCQHIIMSEDINAGIRANGSLSVVRRFFCLFATFDLLFTSLMWLICLVLVGNFDFYQVFNTQILHYHIQTSMFDVVMAAMVRFTALLLFYAILHINHWFIVAVTTAGTSSFLVVKVYIYNWSSTSQPVLQVLLILSSFLISWAEAWFLDLRVIPQERHARDYVNASLTNERSPLLRSYLRGNSRFDAMSESIGTFYSPLDSPEGSDDESDKFHRSRLAIPYEMVRQYRAKGEETLEVAWKTLNNDKWTVEKELNTGDQVYKQKFSGQTIFKLKAIINASTSELFEILYKKVEETPMWNPTLKESKIIQEVDDSTDILYQITGEIGGGVISSRDFVILRHWQRKYGHLIISNVSVTSPCTPQPKKIIRGENGVGCWALKDVGDSRSQLLWLLNTNIKGWVPKYAVNANLMTVMTEFMDHLRKRIMDSSSVRQNS